MIKSIIFVNIQMLFKRDASKLDILGTYLHETRNRLLYIRLDDLPLCKKHEVAFLRLMRSVGSRLVLMKTIIIR